MPDLSRITNVYVPRGNCRTLVVPFFRVIVKPGPTVPVSLRAAGAAVVDPAAKVIAATAEAIRLSMVRVISRSSVRVHQDDTDVRRQADFTSWRGATTFFEALDPGGRVGRTFKHERFPIGGEFAVGGQDSGLSERRLALPPLCGWGRTARQQRQSRYRNGWRNRRESEPGRHDDAKGIRAPEPNGVR